MAIRDIITNATFVHERWAGCRDADLIAICQYERHATDFAKALAASEDACSQRSWIVTETYTGKQAEWTRARIDELKLSTVAKGDVDPA